jgi:NADH:ubiquinone oxidoreductase subunit 6 (subunit J)
MMLFFLLLSVGLCIYLITNSFKLASRIAKTNPDLVKYKRSIQYIGGVGIMILLVYSFLAIETLQDTFTLWGRVIWIFMMLAMFFIYMGFIKPSRISEQKS